MAKKDEKLSPEELTESVSTNFDAQQISEKIDSGEQTAPSVNVEADYKESKKFESADGPDLDAPETGIVEGEAAGDPEAFRSIARQVKKPS